MRAFIAPIRRLNADVIRLIVAEVNSQEINATSKCSSVCRFWRDVVLQTPTLWSTIRLGPVRLDIPPRYAELCISRAIDVPLSLSIATLTGPYLSILAKELHRIKSLKVRISTDLPLAQGMFPSLLHLSRSNPYYGSGSIQNIVGMLENRDLFPSVTHLTLKEFYIRPTAHFPSFRDLRRLHLRGCRLLNLHLLSFENLEPLYCVNLELERASQINRTWKLPHPSSFPRLSFLSYTFKPDYHKRVIPTITAPRLTSLENNNSCPPDLLGEVPYLKNLDVIFDKGCLDLSSFVTSLTVHDTSGYFCKDLTRNLVALPDSLEEFNLLRCRDSTEELAAELVGLLRKRSIAVRLNGERIL